MPERLSSPFPGQEYILPDETESKSLKLHHNTLTVPSPSIELFPFVGKQKLLRRLNTIS